MNLQQEFDEIQKIINHFDINEMQYRVICNAVLRGYKIKQPKERIIIDGQEVLIRHIGVVAWLDEHFLNDTYAMIFEPHQIHEVLLHLNDMHEQAWLSLMNSKTKTAYLKQSDSYMRSNSNLSPIQHRTLRIITALLLNTPSQFAIGQWKKENYTLSN